MDGIYALVGLIVGAGLSLLLLRNQGAGEIRSMQDRLREKDDQGKRDQDQIKSLNEQLLTETAARSRLEAEIRQRDLAFEEQKKTLLEAEQKLTHAFESLSQAALAKSADQFLQLAKENFEKHREGASGDLRLRQQAIEELVKPLKETLDKLDKQSQEVEQKRVAAYDGVTEHINRLILETTQLSSALRKPHVRGSWGELTLRRAAESAGLIEGQDFEMQFSTDTEEGRLRPDMIVRLPNSGVIVVDSKVPLEGYLDAAAATDQAIKDLKLQAHAAQVRRHIQQLSSKDYWKQFDRSPDFVVMFVPAESLYQAAMEQDIDLMETAFRHRVVLANPMTLIALLRTVAYGMSQERVRENAVEIKNIGEKLYDAVRIFATHMDNVGRHLGQTTVAFNKAVGSMDKNLVSRARQLKGLGAGVGDDPAVPEPLDLTPRSPQAGSM